MKRHMARLLDRARISGALIRAQASFLGPHIRIVNYHDVPTSQAGAFERQLELYRRHFAPVGYDDLLALHAKRYQPPRPGLILSFDDGLRSHAEVVAPLLERHGFIGWFLVPVGLVEAKPQDQSDLAARGSIWHEPANPVDPRIALTWSDLLDLDRRHVIGCHGWSHRRLTASLTSEDLDQEIVLAKRRLEQQLGREVPLFAWIGGEEVSYSASAARAIRDAGFRVGLMTNNAIVRPGSDLLQLQRTNIEASDPLWLVRFQLSGLLDLLYSPKRHRVNRLTAAPRDAA